MTSKWIVAQVVTSKTKPNKHIIRLACSDMPSPPKDNERVLVQVRRARNIQHHRLYWGMLRVVVEATGKWASTDALHRWLKYALGLYDRVEIMPGKVIIEWRSTDFSSMAQSEFKCFFDNAVAEIATETGIDPIQLTGELTDEVTGEATVI